MRVLHRPTELHPIEDEGAWDLTADCICGPRTEPVEREDGSYGWVIVHHSLDGREAA